MKRITLVLLIGVVSSCCQTIDQESNYQEISIAEIDSLWVNGLLTEEFFPNKTCGGLLLGFYDKDQLVLMQAFESGELSSYQRKIYLNGSGFLKIVYRKHIPEMEQYFQKYPLESHRFDPDKLTYADTLYEITFGKNSGFKKSTGNKLLSTTIDSFLVRDLVNCGEQMQNALDM